MILVISLSVSIFLILVIQLVISKPFAKSSDVVGDADNKYNCAVYDERLWELKLFGAGIIKESEMTFCNNNVCLNCKSHKVQSYCIYY